jgi:hypothetical protein
MSTTIEASAGSYAVSTTPTSRPYGYSAVILKSTTPSILAYFDFGQPVQPGWTVISAYLRLYQQGAATGGSRTLTARLIAAPWKESTLDWNTKPAVVSEVSGGYSSAAQGDGGANGRLWQIDVTAAMQAVAAGQPFYGFRIQSNNTTKFYLFSDEASAYRPELVITVAPEPSAPTVLNPSGGRAVSIAKPTVTFDFTDPDGDSMLSYQVQANDTTNDFTSPDLDTGTVAATVPAYTWTTDITAGVLTWWRARVQDSAGLWSDWSEPESFIRTAKPTVAWVDPAAAVFTDPNLPTDVSLSGGPTQTARQVFVLDSAGVSVLFDSGKVATTTTAYGVSGEFLPTPGETYTLLRRTWDNVDRATTSGATADPPYVDISKQVTFDTSGTSPVSALAAGAEAGGLPGITLTWTDATATADEYLITRDGVAYALVDFADTFVSGTSHEWTDKTPNGRNGHDYQLFAVTAGVTSDGSAVVNGINVPEGVWVRTASGLALQLTGLPGAPAELSVEPNELSAVYSPVGAANQVVLRQARYRRKGRLENGAFGDGLTTDLDDLAALEVTWEAIRTYADTHPVTLVTVNKSFQALIFNTWTGFADEAIVNNPGSWVPVGFEYVEQV